MRIYQKESERLKNARSLIRARFPQFGVNKSQELVRLVYEISKRDGISPRKTLVECRGDGYDLIKRYLIKMRYPRASRELQNVKPYLPKIELSGRFQADTKKHAFSPKNIYIQRSAMRSDIAGRARSIFPSADFTEIESLKGHLASRGKTVGVEEYNERRDTLFLVTERYDLLKKCPCTGNAAGCGYWLLNLGFGCIFDCSYCFLQGYTNSPGLVLPVNVNSFLDLFAGRADRIRRIGTGEFTDSLALDRLTEYSLTIIDYFKARPDVLFEFKTKSDVIENVLKREGARNIIISWSLNPQKIIDNNEFFTASLKRRIYSAARCADNGYRVGFHFDPVIYFKGWEREYEKVIDAVFDSVEPEDIAWISIGTFRFAPALKPCIEKRFSGNTILDEELLPGFDGKLRYPYPVRFHIYRKMIDLIIKRSPKAALYLCMEEAGMWRGLKLRMPRFQ